MNASKENAEKASEFLKSVRKSLQDIGDNAPMDHRLVFLEEFLASVAPRLLSEAAIEAERQRRSKTSEAEQLLEPRGKKKPFPKRRLARTKG